MIKEIARIERAIFKKLNLYISNVQEDKEYAAYSGYNFQFSGMNIKFREAKTTPGKIGKFVTLWKRNASGETEPFNVEDNYNFYIITAENENQSGFFCFPKSVLTEKQLLTVGNKTGKRDFRVYTDWDIPENQAIKTRQWQSDFFIDLNKLEDVIIEKWQQIFRQTGFNQNETAL